VGLESGIEDRKSDERNPYLRLFEDETSRSRRSEGEGDDSDGSIESLALHVFEAFGRGRITRSERRDCPEEDFVETSRGHELFGAAVEESQFKTKIIKKLSV
jgi:hypothetical protein